jgi:hypothetical protein
VQYILEETFETVFLEYDDGISSTSDVDDENCLWRR